METLDFYLQYIFEAEAKTGTILNMQKSKCQYLRRLFDASRRDLGNNDAKTIRLKSKVDSCEKQTDTMTKSIETKGDTAKISTNVGQGIGKTANQAKRHKQLAIQARAQADVNKAASMAKQQYHSIVGQAAVDCSSVTNKTACMRKFKIQAVQSARSELARGMAACNNTKDPSKCMKRLRKKMDKYTSKLKRLTT